MSYDLKIQNKCDHYINWERSELQSDRRTIRLLHPVAAEASLQLRINNVLIDSSEYTLLLRQERMVVESNHTIYMNRKIRLNQPLIEVKYTTEVTHCPKCLGIKVLDDIVFTTGGDIRTINREFLLVQMVEKYIVTKISSNPFHDWVGTDLHSLIGQKIFDQDLIRSKIVEQINNAIEKLKSIQRQMVGSGRRIDAGELFGELISIDLENTDDPTIVLVNVTFTAQSGRTLEYSQYLELSAIRERVSFV